MNVQVLPVIKDYIQFITDRHQGKDRIKKREPFLPNQPPALLFHAGIDYIDQIQKDPLAVRASFLHLGIPVHRRIVENSAVMGQHPLPSAAVHSGERMAVVIFHRSDRGIADMGDERISLYTGLYPLTEILAVRSPDRLFFNIHPAVFLHCDPPSVRMFFRMGEKLFQLFSE